VRKLAIADSEAIVLKTLVPLNYAVLAGLALLALLSGCWVSEDVCGEHQVFSGELILRCVCAEGYVVAENERGCVACGDNTVVVNGECRCAQGYARAAADAACTEIAAGEAELGGACADDTDCVEPYGYCAGDGDGYCTATGCSDHSDCETDWYCAQDDSGAYCQRPPTGLGLSCKSDADCAGYEATYCEVFQTQTCQVVGCAEGETACHGDWACCDFRTLFGVSMCVTPDTLDASGMCPAGAGNPVTP